MFDSIVGQENAGKTLRVMIESGRIPHALLFAGPYGVGKGETALEFARMLLCENGLNSGCNTCSSCRRAARLEHPDLHVVFPYRRQPQTSKGYDSWMDGLIEHRKLLARELYAPVVYEKGRQIVTGLVGEVHERLQESSFEGGRKVAVIIAADRLNDKTANSLLKILEEPGAGVHFILTTERLSSVLPTIVSRASIVRFRRLKIEEIESYLEKAGVTEPEKRHAFAVLGEGSLKTAKAFAFSDIADIRSKAFELYTSVALGGNDTVVSNVYPFLWSRDFLETEELINGFAQCTRSVLETRVGLRNKTDDNSETFEKLSHSTDIPSLHRLSTRLEEGLDMLGRNVNISLVLTIIFYEILDTFSKRQFGQERHYHL